MKKVYLWTWSGCEVHARTRVGALLKIKAYAVSKQYRQHVARLCQCFKFNNYKSMLKDGRRHATMKHIKEMASCIDFICLATGEIISVSTFKEALKYFKKYSGMKIQKTDVIELKDYLNK